MSAQVLVSVERWVLVSAVVMVLIAWIIWGTAQAMGSAAAGGLLGILNLLILRRTVMSLVNGSIGTQAAMSVVLLFKMGLLLVAIWAVVRVLGFSPLGVALGVSALVVGIIGGALFTPQNQRQDQLQPER